MHAVSATEFGRNISKMLDEVEHQGVTLSILRNRKQIATVAPGLRRESAMEAFGSLYRPLEGAVKDDWMADIRRAPQGA